MSYKQTKNYILFRKLLRQLADFGLNPSDWRIERVRVLDGTIHLLNRDDHQFRIAGQITLADRGAHWRSLSLTSL